jgi:hypothetical protein
MNEHGVQNEIRIALGRDATLFRNNVAVAWTGEVVRLNTGDILIRNPRPLHAGLFKGSGDLIGWRSITITPEMVGQKIAVFASLEIKGPRGRATSEQVKWAENVIKAGGLAGIVKSVDEAKKALAMNGK